MSKDRLDEIGVRSKESGTDGATIEEASFKKRKDRLVEIEVKSKRSGTVSSKIDLTRKVIPFERYEVVVNLTSDGRFVGIEEVRINKDFRSYSQMTPQKAFEYVDSYHPE